MDQGPVGLNPVDIAITPTGDLLAVDTAGLLFLIMEGRMRTILSDFFDPASGPLGGFPIGVDITPSGTIYVLDGVGVLFTMLGGVREFVTAFEDPTMGPVGTTPSSLAISPDGTIYVLDPFAGELGLGLLFTVEADGTREVFSDFNDDAQGPLGVSLFGIAIGPDGTILVTDEEGGTDSSVVRVRAPCTKTSGTSGGRAAYHTRPNCNPRYCPSGILCVSAITVGTAFKRVAAFPTAIECSLLGKAFKDDSRGHSPSCCYGCRMKVRREEQGGAPRLETLAVTE